MVILMGIMFVLSVQPMVVMSSMILVVLMYSLYLYWMLSSFWFGYMLILIMMSGVMVIFMYMMSILPNESFEISSMVILVFGFIMFYKMEYIHNFIQSVDLGSMKIWSGMMLFSSMFLVSYLLYMMILVVWVSMLEQGAIRIN